MVLQRWYPITSIRRTEDGVDRFRRVGTRPYTYGANGSWTLPVDLEENEDSISVTASIPGISPEDIEATIEDGVLTIKAEARSEDETEGRDYLVRERREGSFHRAVRLPDRVDAEKAESRYENGVLTVSLPKQESKKARRLEVKVQG